MSSDGSTENGLVRVIDSKKTGRETVIQPNEPGSFAWFWASSNSSADESLLAFRPPDSHTSKPDDRLAA